ncbi:hypothetical protein WJX77_008886 [Trebouxia sp. C0004]
MSLTKFVDTADAAAPWAVQKGCSNLRRPLADVTSSAQQSKDLPDTIAHIFCGASPAHLQSSHKQNLRRYLSTVQ